MLLIIVIEVVKYKHGGKKEAMISRLNNFYELEWKL